MTSCGGFPRGFPNVIKLLSILNPHKGYYSPFSSIIVMATVMRIIADYRVIRFAVFSPYSVVQGCTKRLIFFTFKLYTMLLRWSLKY